MDVGCVVYIDNIEILLGPEKEGGEAAYCFLFIIPSINMKSKNDKRTNSASLSKWCGHHRQIQAGASGARPS